MPGPFFFWEVPLPFNFKRLPSFLVWPKLVQSGVKIRKFLESQFSDSSESHASEPSTGILAHDEHVRSGRKSLGGRAPSKCKSDGGPATSLVQLHRANSRRCWDYLQMSILKPPPSGVRQRSNAAVEIHPCSSCGENSEFPILRCGLSIGQGEVFTLGWARSHWPQACNCRLRLQGHWHRLPYCCQTC